MPATRRIEVDVAIFGGGAAGLWALDTLTRAGFRTLLLESGALGSGQTIAAQGIIHGGLKYTLDGNAGDSARAIAEMPRRWRESLRGERAPHLERTKVRADWCSLWRTRQIRSQVGMAGALAVLQVKPRRIERNERPAVLAETPGDVYRLDEPVIDPASLIDDLSQRHRERVLHFNFDGGSTFDVQAGDVRAIRLDHPAGGAGLDVHARSVLFTAGEGNGQLRQRVGLPAAMQLRPLHMVLVRGDLPLLNGHCTDGARTRATITSATDSSGQRVWQVGGQVAEDGVAMTAAAVVAHAQREVAAILPGFSPDRVEWAAYRVNRAEGASADGERPSDISCRQDGNVFTGWPTKLALVPRLADRLLEMLPQPHGTQPMSPIPEDWPRPTLARPPWEREGAWSANS